MSALEPPAATAAATSRSRSLNPPTVRSPTHVDHLKRPVPSRKASFQEIKTLAAHAMENGFRRTQTGELIARDIITQFVCTYNGLEIFRADLFPAIAANPFISFFTVATASGTIEFKWTGDNGFSQTETANITVE